MEKHIASMRRASQQGCLNEQSEFAICLVVSS
jgi:hypothetical protein